MIGSAPLLLATGEPAGIGPDLCLQLAAGPAARRVVVISDPGLLEARAARLGTKLAIRIVDAGTSVEPDDLPPAGTLDVLPIRFPREPVPGRLDPANASALLDGLALAVDELREGRYHALVTGPMQKSVVNDAGIAFSGHTEYLAELCGVERPVMLLVADDLRVALATTHLPLGAVAESISPALIRETLQVLAADLARRFGIAEPRIGVCGLNPHAGEGGHLGREELDVIAPVVAELCDGGMRVSGPLPADTIFTGNAGSFDAILAMYHDQGLPVVKYAGFGHAVNVTLGLPIIRTSVDHGTALSIAGSGDADAGSLRAAIELAATLS